MNRTVKKPPTVRIREKSTQAPDNFNLLMEIRTE